MELHWNLVPWSVSLWRCKWLRPLNGERETGLSSSGASAQGWLMLALKASKTTFALPVGED